MGESDRHTCLFIFMKFHKHEALCFYYLCTKTVEKIIDFLFVKDLISSGVHGICTSGK